MLFQTRITAPRIVLFQYAVASDGKRFLINSLPPVGATPLTNLTNGPPKSIRPTLWTAEG
jgi:eukaryotic-like serine/threonine-protein kinase